MTPRRPVLALLAAGLSWLAAAGIRADVVGTPWEFGAAGRASQAWMDAWRAHDEARLAALAADPTLDPVVLVGGLLSAHALGARKDPPEPKDFLAAAVAFAGHVRTRATARGVPGLVAAWQAFGRGDLEREMRVRSGLEEVRALRERGAASEALERIARLEPDLPDSRSHRAVFVLVEKVGTLIDLARWADAGVAASAAVALAQALGWPQGAARAHLLTAAAADGAGDADGALAGLTRGRDLYAELGDEVVAAGLDVERSVLLRREARYEEALAAVHRGRDQARRAGRPGQAAEALVAEATILALLGRTIEGRALCEQAATEAQAAGDLGAAARALGWLAVSYTQADRYAAALGHHERAVALAERGGDPLLLANTLTNYGVALRRLRLVERALAVQERAASVARGSASAQRVLGMALGNLGIVEAELGRPGFRKTLEEALAAKRGARDLRGATETGLALGSLLARNPATRAEGDALLAKNLDLLRRAHDPAFLAAGLFSVGESKEQAGDPSGARAAYEESRALLAEVGERSPRAAGVEEGLARLSLARGELGPALEAAERAVAIRRSLIVGLGDDDAAALLERARTASDLGLEVCRRLAATGSAPDTAARAFALAEAGRTILLTAGLVNAEAFLAAEVPAGALREEASSRARLDAARRALRAAASAATPSRERLADARRGLDAASQAHDRAVARIQREAARAAGVVWPEPARAADLCARLDRDTAFVGYQFTSAAAVALVATSDGVRLVDLGASEALLGPVEAYARLVSTPGSDEAPAAVALFERLVRPLEAALAGRTRLLISPDGPLAFLPFEALLREEGGRRERLLERYEVTYAPSATAYLALGGEPGSARVGRGFVGLGDPAPGAGADALPPLPGSAAEVRAVAALHPGDATRLLLGAEATASALAAALPAPPGRLAALHVACHAFIDPERPRLSALVLAGGEVLDVDAIHRLRLPADLVVLSACATGKGRLLRGEGVLGFCRGFFVAGVPRVVVSDWVVADDDAARLLVAFHTHLQRGALAPAAALRAAKREALAGGGARAHPAAWAAFVLWGLER